MVSNSLYITRLDVAYDDHTGVLDIDQIAENVKLVSVYSGVLYGRWISRNFRF